jgi:hypothetical protein
MYGLWLAANPVDNGITQLILLILIGYLFLFSIQWYIIFRSANYPAIISIVMYIALSILTVVQANIVSDGSSLPLNGYIYRNWAIGLGLGTCVPVLTVIIGDLVSGCNPVPTTD